MSIKLRHFIIIFILFGSLVIARNSVAQEENPQASFTDDGQVYLGEKLLLNIQQDAPDCFNVGDILYSPIHTHFLVVFDCIEGDNVGFIFQANGTNKAQITTTSDYINNHAYDWSPDGKWLIYQRVNSFGHELFSDMPPDGLVRYSIETGKKDTLIQRVNGVSPRWSLDGKWIAFYVINNLVSKTTIYLLQADGSALWELDSFSSIDEKSTLTWVSDARGELAVLKYVSSDILQSKTYSISANASNFQSSESTKMLSIFPYAIVGVDMQDTLNIRSDAGVSNSVVGTIPPDGTSILVTGEGVRRGKYVWLPIEYSGVNGWVNGIYLEPQLGLGTASDTQQSIYLNIEVPQQIQSHLQYSFDKSVIELSIQIVTQNNDGSITAKVSLYNPTSIAYGISFFVNRGNVSGGAIEYLLTNTYELPVLMPHVSQSLGTMTLYPETELQINLSKFGFSVDDEAYLRRLDALTFVTVLSGVGYVPDKPSREWYWNSVIERVLSKLPFGNKTAAFVDGALLALQTIRGDKQAQIDSIADFLKEHPELVVEYMKKQGVQMTVGEVKNSVVAVQYFQMIVDGLPVLTDFIGKPNNSTVLLYTQRDLAPHN